MIITINRQPAWGTMPVGSVCNLPDVLAQPLIDAGQAVPTPGAVVTVDDPFAGGASSGISAGYLGNAASQAAMLGLAATVGDECLRTDLGTGGLRYELTALPASSAGNWQPVQGTLSSGTMVTLSLVAGKLPRRLLVGVATGDQVTVAVGGSTLPVLVETVSGQFHEILISDDPTAAQPTTVTIQRTSGSGTTSTYSLEA